MRTKKAERSSYQKTATKKRHPRKKKLEKKEIVADKKRSVKREYLFAVGRRKEAVARVRLYQKGEGEIIINSRKLATYFPTLSLQRTAQKPLEIVNTKFGQITIKVRGGGKKGQAESVCLGIARVLEKFDSKLRSQLKKAKLLRRDARIKERKKYGLKRARRAPQWHKR